MTTQQHHFAGIKVSPIRVGDLMHQVRAALSAGGQLRISFLNPDYARRALQDLSLRVAINTFDLVLVDGNGVRWLAPMFGCSVPERLDTDSVAPLVFRLAATDQRGVFLFGCAPGVADAAAERLQTAFPGIQIVGVEHGYHDVQRGHPGSFDPVDSQAIVDAINASAAEIVLVSLPTPLQQRWVADYGRHLAAPVVMTGGSYLDHIATNPRFPERWYPRWADVLRLNWFYRLIHEPRRLWRRYTTEMFSFFVLSVRARLRGGTTAGETTA